MCAICGVLSQFVLFCCKISFVSLYDVLSRNLSCRDLCAFAWRKMYPKIVYVEKKLQIWGKGRRSRDTGTVEIWKCFWPTDLSTHLIRFWRCLYASKIVTPKKTYCNMQIFCKSDCIHFSGHALPLRWSVDKWWIMGISLQVFNYFRTKISWNS